MKHIISASAYAPVKPQKNVPVIFLYTRAAYQLMLRNVEHRTDIGYHRYVGIAFASFP